MCLCELFEAPPLLNPHFERVNSSDICAHFILQISELYVAIWKIKLFISFTLLRLLYGFSKSWLILLSRILSTSIVWYLALWHFPFWWGTISNFICRLPLFSYQSYHPSIGNFTHQLFSYICCSWYAKQPFSIEKAWIFNLNFSVVRCSRKMNACANNLIVIFLVVDLSFCILFNP